MFRGAIRGAIRRGIRRSIRRRARRIIRGAFVVLMLKGTTRTVKIRAEDARKIEATYHKPPEEMTEAELNEAMQKLNVKQQELNAEDQGQVDAADEQDEK